MFHLAYNSSAVSMARTVAVGFPGSSLGLAHPFCGGRSARTWWFPPSVVIQENSTRILMLKTRKEHIFADVSCNP